MKKLTKTAIAITVIAATSLSSFSIFAVENEASTEFERPAFTMNMKARKFGFGRMFKLSTDQNAEENESEEAESTRRDFCKKMFKGEKPELTEEQKAAIAEKIESGEFKPCKRGFGRMNGKKEFDGERPELTEEQKAAIAEKRESGEFKFGRRKMSDGERPELTEEQKAEMKEKFKNFRNKKSETKKVSE